MIEIIILGFLKEKAASGYDIKKFIEKKLDLFSEINTSSIYYPLQKMEKEGLIQKKELKGQTHLKKYVYKLTEKGEKEFIKLCNKTLISTRRPSIDIDIPLYFLPYLPKKDVLIRLRLRKRFLYQVKKWFKNKFKEHKEFLPHQILLFKHHFQLLSAEEEFIKNFIEFIKQSNGKNSYN
ncbi:MAG: PadR family transcriptional regulator [Candidatus Omnitrophica bacterium]|nr:PadR family transcriptional regulator [Candidatus Omnitrophota bacterium]MCM8831583.1 PadR family transcriptional regulator [Candidatus Omnitrophota bacterium]